MPNREKFQPTTYYHIFNRGIYKSTLFHDRKDFERFIYNIQKYKEQLKDQIEIIAYSVLPNHFHFVLRNKAESHAISYFIGNVCVSYVRYYKTKYQKLRKGAEYFEGRFHSKPIEDEEYLQQCIYYVEHNAVKHGLVRNPEDRIFTSYDPKKQKSDYKEVLEMDREFG